MHLPPSLRHRRFRLLWAGQAISVAGSQMQIWALFWHISQLSDEPIALGGVGLARLLPILVFSLVGGALADVIDRRKLLFVTQSVLMLQGLVLAWLTFTGQVTLWHIYALTAIQAMAIAFDQPARQSLVPNLVPARDLANAFSMQSMAFQTGAIAGPALSGLVIAYLGQPYTYLINAITFLALLFALVLIGPVSQGAREAAKEGSALEAARGAVQAGRRSYVSLPAIAEGVRFILSHPIILSTMVLDFFATFFSSANTLMPIVAQDVLHVGEVEYGWLSAAQSVGAVGAALVISQLPAIRKQGPIFFGSVVAFGLATIAFGLARQFAVAFLALVFVGASDSVSTIIRNTIRQLQTPDYIRGRMTSVNQIFFMGGPQFGEVEAGLAAQLFGAPLAIISGGAGCILAVTWIARRWPQLRAYNGDEPVLAGATAD